MREEKKKETKLRRRSSDLKTKDDGAYLLRIIYTYILDIQIDIKKI